LIHSATAMSRWPSLIPRRDACAHADGAIRMIASARSTFAGEADRHATRGPCAAVRARALLPVPAPRLIGGDVDANPRQPNHL
jgi:hypothetical protein